MKRKSKLVASIAAVLSIAMLAGCGGSAPAPSAPPASSAPASASTPASESAPAASNAAAKTPERDYILIGIPNPQTGPVASFGEGSPWAENLAVDKINAEGGIYIKEYDKKLPIKLKIVDTEGNATKGSEVTQKLIVDDKVDLLISRHTPETALPVSTMSEKFQVPCVSMECPVDPWLEGGPYEWVYHAFWPIDTVCTVYMDLWKSLKFGEGTKVGILMPNDPDGLAWAPIFAEKLPQNGFTVVDPGRYPIGNGDWTSIINMFKKEGVEIVTGVNIPPDYAAFAKQAKQLGFEPKLTTMGKAFLFTADANALGVDLADGLTAEVWFSNKHPFKSSIDGMSAQELCDKYEAEFKKPWAAHIGYKYACMEIAIDALKRAETLDKTAIRDAIGATDMTTIVGPIKYGENHVAYTPLVAGQWVKNAAGDAVEIKIVDNTLYPEIPKAQDPVIK